MLAHPVKLEDASRRDVDTVNFDGGRQRQEDIKHLVFYDELCLARHILRNADHYVVVEDLVQRRERMFFRIVDKFPDLRRDVERVCEVIALARRHIGAVLNDQGTGYEIRLLHRVRVEISLRVVLRQTFPGVCVFAVDRFIRADDHAGRRFKHRSVLTRLAVERQYDLFVI